MQIIEETIQNIAKEISEAKANQWTITKIVKELSGMNTVSEKKLREKALEMLKELDQEAAIIYERFSKMRVYNSNEKLAAFNRGNIIKSLTKETSLSRGVAEKITLEVENQIKDSKIEFLTAGLIRELVNSKLISYGYEEVRHNYARLGEPVFEIKNKIMKEPYFSEATREYNLTLAIPKKAKDLHHEGIIFIEDTTGYSNRIYSYSLLAEKKETLEKTILGNLKQLIDEKRFFYLEPNIYGITHACSCFVKNESQAKKAGELLSETLKIAGDNFTTSIELFQPEKITSMKSDKVLSAKIGEQLIGKNKCVVGIDSKYGLKLIETKEKHFTILNNSEEEYFPLNNNLFSPTQGIDLFVSINLEKIAQDNDKDKFLQQLRETSEQIKELIKDKKQRLAEKEYLKKFVPELKTGIGLTNLFSVAETLKEEKVIEFANKTYRELNKIFDEELLFGCTQNARAKFGETCGKEIQTQHVLDFEECLSSKKCCFTGRATNTKELEELLTRKVKQIEYVG